MIENKKIFVYKDWDAETPELIGRLYIDGTAGKEVISFEYDDSWLENVNNLLLFDPDLNLYKGRQYAPIEKNLFGVFEDSCPDRWRRSSKSICCSTGWFLVDC